MSCTAVKRDKVEIQLQEVQLRNYSDECRITIWITLSTSDKQRAERLCDEPITAQDVIGLLIDCDDCDLN